LTDAITVRAGPPHGVGPAFFARGTDVPLALQDFKIALQNIF